ncbi:MAG: hypothetical protein ABIH26_00355 [Candidatus Eisenbacteria bacterium]
MKNTEDQFVTITLPRKILEHSKALHIRRMRSALWLYLVLLAEPPEDGETLRVDPGALARRMGLREGTVRSWLGHLRKAGYLEARGTNGTIRVRLLHLAPQKASPGPGEPPRAFTVVRLARALGEQGEEETLRRVLEDHSDDLIRKALANTLAVPPEQIRKSRTALFLFLLKRYAEEDNHSRH